jgi:hypothetical protein
MDRKKFLQQTTGLAAGSFLIPGVLKAAFSNEVKPMRVANLLAYATSIREGWSMPKRF